MGDYGQYTAVSSLPLLPLLQNGPSMGCGICSGTSSASSSNPVVEPCCFSFFFFPPLLTVQCLLPFLEYIFPKAPPAWLMGSAVPCSGSPGAGHVQPGAAPGLFSQHQQTEVSQKAKGHICTTGSQSAQRSWRAAEPAAPSQQHHTASCFSETCHLGGTGNTDRA